MATQRRAPWLTAALAAAIVGAACTANLDDVNPCYAIARAYCERAAACDPAVTSVTADDISCTGNVYEFCASMVTVKGVPTNLLGSIPNVRSCLAAIDQTQCGQPPGSACGTLVALPGAGSADGGTPPSDASSGGDVAAQ